MKLGSVWDEKLQSHITYILYLLESAPVAFFLVQQIRNDLLQLPLIFLVLIPVFLCLLQQAFVHLAGGRGFPGPSPTT